MCICVACRNGERGAIMGTETQIRKGELAMFSENLKTLRKSRGMSQEVLAQQLHVVRQTVSKWEKGLSVPDAELLTRIAELFEVPVSDLLGEKIQQEQDTNQVAAQLAQLNEYLANKSRRNRRIVRGVLIALAALMLTAILSVALLTAMYSVSPRHNSSEEIVEME